MAASGAALLCSTGCGYLAARVLEGEEVTAPESFNLEDDKTPCYLELERGARALRVNCFDIDGELHIHSSRWANLPRFSGESWTVTIQRDPGVRVEIAGRIYTLNGILIEDEQHRQQILYNRNYWYAWEAIKVFKFLPGAADRKINAGEV